MVIIFDYTNDGIVYVTNHLLVANKIKEGLLDCDTAFPGPNVESYDLLDPEKIEIENYSWNRKKQAILNLTEDTVNPIFLYKKTLAHMRAPAIKFLARYCDISCRKLINFPAHWILSEWEYVLEKSNPYEDRYSYSVVEYAQICGIPEREAYKQLKLRVDGQRSTLLRIYSYMDYFSHKINNSYTNEEIAAIKEEIDKKFFKDSYV